MIVLRKDQKKSLALSRMNRLTRDIIAYIREHFPEQCSTKTDTDLNKFIENILSKAMKYGLAIERDIYKFVNIIMLYGLHFDEQDETQWMIEYLQDEEVPIPSQRLNRLYEEIVFRLEVEENNEAIRKRFYND